jgi:hypothetical protein
MTPMPPTLPSDADSPMTSNIGRAKGIIVFENNGNPKGAITPLIARTVPDSASEIRFAGVVAVTPEVESHANHVVLPLVDSICKLLGVPTSGIVVDMANVDAASSSDLALRVSGLSAELPLFLAVLSARLLLPVPPDMVATGHIGSLDGDIRIVRNLPAKLKAAFIDNAISRFVCPCIRSDTSMAVLKPKELVSIEVAVSAAEQRLAIVQVGDVAEAVRRVFDERDIALASLRSGFFTGKESASGNDSIVERAAGYLAQDGRRRFLNALQALYLREDIAGAHAALNMWGNAHRERRMYPTDFGCDLLYLLAALPPTVRETTSRTAGLVPLAICRALTDLATERDEEDIKLLWRAASDVWPATDDALDGNADEEHAGEESLAERIVRELMRDLAVEHLARRIGIPIDTARETFRIEATVARSYDEFIRTIVSFYIHMERATGRAGGTTALQEADANALALLDQAFHRHGGVKAAWSQSQTGTQGGLRYVLDQCAQHYKQEKQQQYASARILSAIDPLEWNDRVAVVTAILKMHPHLRSTDLNEEHPERFADKYPEMLRACVQSMDSAREALRAL